MTKPTLPAGVLEQHTIVLGKTRSGKSSVMRGMVEGLFEDERPACVIDPKGDWWGLKSSANGKSAGYPVIIFGGEHADVPLNAHAGAHVAELVATGNRPCIIDLGGWMIGERTRFYIDFASVLFKLTRGRRYLVIDECHNFAPKGKIMDPDAGKMLHWSNRLASEGLGKGLHIIAASQRPQKVHNDFLTSCETIIAMRVTHPRDREAIAEWVDGCADPAVGKEVLKGLAQTARGTGWVWSPEIGFGPQQVAFPMFKTYDSFKAQTGEHSARLKGWASVDLDDVTAKLSAVVEEAKANDPKALKAELAKVKAELAKKATAKPAAAAKPAGPRREDVAVIAALKKALGEAMKIIVEINTKALTDKLDKLDPADIKAIEKGVAAAVESIRRQIEVSHTSRNQEFHRLRKQSERTVESLKRLLKDDVHLSVDVRANEPFSVTPSRPAQRPPARQSGNGGTMAAGGLRRMMIALAQRPQGLTRRGLGVRAGLSSSSGTFATYLARGRTEGWIGGNGSLITVTETGIASLGEHDPLPTGRDLLAYWLRELGEGGAGRLLQAVADAYPAALSRDQAAQAAGMSAGSGTFATYLSRLRTLELITGRGDLKASDELFE